MERILQTILVLSPHTDDSELGCGGTVARFIEEGRNIHVAAFSACEKSVPPECPPDILVTEWHQALNILGVPAENRTLFHYPVREFPQYRQEILDRLITFRDQLKPDLVFLPSRDDLHQDHQVIAMEGLRAFKGTSILGYEIPWNNILFETRSFVHLEERHIHQKIAALKCYKSQAFRGYASSEFVFSLARTRGIQIEIPYAEVFEAIRWIIR